MKISRQQASQVLNAYLKEVRKVDSSNTKVGKAPSSSKDQVTLSEAAQFAQRLMPKVRELPDVRADKVANLKERLEKGEYEVSGQDVADQIVARWLGNQSGNLEV